MSMESLALSVVNSREELTEDIIHQWRQLESTALENNIYLSPDFILPSLEHLSPGITPIFIFIFYGNPINQKMIFAAVFEQTKPFLSRPFRSLKSYENQHCFLSGFLLDKSLYREALDTFFRFFASQRCWQALDLGLHWGNTFQSQQIYASANHWGLKWIPVRKQERAAILHSIEFQPISKISKNLLKNIYKKKILLTQLGDLQYRYTCNAELIPEAINTFLTLEHSSWKGKNGTSLLSQSAQSQFFHSMTLSFAKENKAVFTELLLSGKVIASTVNYTSGNIFFAFKTARDEKFEQYSIGIINEISLIENIPNHFPTFQIFDSGSETGSYMNSIWKDKILLASGYFTKNPLFRAYLGVGQLYSYLNKYFRTAQH